MFFQSWERGWNKEAVQVVTVAKLLRKRKRNEGTDLCDKESRCEFQFWLVMEGEGWTGILIIIDPNTKETPLIT